MLVLTILLVLQLQNQIPCLAKDLMGYLDLCLWDVGFEFVSPVPVVGWHFSFEFFTGQLNSNGVDSNMSFSRDDYLNKVL